ncbi:3-hydroxylacyl-ACP dehydratase [Roseateles chitinivorans]|uniref:ApeP family dehydratase n=1 Tax=Roseateles chitinivorans TaxID=2917965 RepID=UPI003D66CEB8
MNPSTPSDVPQSESGAGDATAFDLVFPMPAADLVPHAGRMSLLTRVLSCEEDRLVAEAALAGDQLFHDSQGDGTGIGGWIGIELMAQAVAAWAGVQGRARGEPPRIGLLLGCRKYRSTRGRFEAGETLRIEIAREFQADNGLGQFACVLHLASGTPPAADEPPLAQAQLTVFGPPDPAAFLAGVTTG